jgi:hypothetical protein
MPRKPTDLDWNLHDALRMLFSKEEIAALAWELRVDVEDLDGRSKQSMARSLIEHAAAYGRTRLLADIVLRERPHARVYAPRSK